MREIKFRVWTGSKMMEVGVLDIDDGRAMDYYNWYDGYCGEDVHYVNSGVLMQYTGLKDKNGKEIYEGDIILSDNHFGCITGGDLFPSMRKVVYDQREAKFSLAFIATEDYAKAFNPSGQYLCKPNCEGSFEVIGNVYENPELLKTA